MRSLRARVLSSATRSRVGAIRIESVSATGAVGGPRGVGLVGAGTEVADVDAAPVGVERDRRRVAFAQRESGGCFGVVEAAVAVAEAVHFAEGDGADLVGDVAQHAAGGDRGELPVVADEPHLAAAAR